MRGDLLAGNARFAAERYDGLAAAFSDAEAAREMSGPAALDGSRE